jgi:hypothetical protein
MTRRTASSAAPAPACNFQLIYPPLRPITHPAAAPATSATTTTAATASASTSASTSASASADSEEEEDSDDGESETEDVKSPNAASSSAASLATVATPTTAAATTATTSASASSAGAASASAVVTPDAKSADSKSAAATDPLAQLNTHMYSLSAAASAPTALQPKQLKATYKRLKQVMFALDVSTVMLLKCFPPCVLRVCAVDCQPLLQPTVEHVGGERARRTARSQTGGRQTCGAEGGRRQASSPHRSKTIRAVRLRIRGGARRGCERCFSCCLSAACRPQELSVKFDISYGLS